MIGRSCPIRTVAGQSDNYGGWSTNLNNDDPGTIRHFDPLDVVRCALVGENSMRNHAFTLSGLSHSRSFGVSLLDLSRKRLSPRAKDAVWVWCEGQHVLGIASVRPRVGKQSWEVSNLYLDSPAKLPVADLLEHLSVSAASQGAERVFLRLQQDDEVISAARLSGFFPMMQETLFRGSPLPEESGQGSLFDAEMRLRKKEKPDDYGLFRLHNVATPADVRTLSGMTFDQWAASHEQSPGRYDERVFEGDGAIRGWLGTARRSSVGNIAAMLHPDDEAVTEDIVIAGLRRLSNTKSVFCLVPEYQYGLSRTLEEQGFLPEGAFITLVKSTAKTIRESKLARSALASSEPM